MMKLAERHLIKRGHRFFAMKIRSLSTETQLKNPSFQEKELREVIIEL